MGVNGIYGLSGSGLDVESMVKAGMLSKQSQYDKMQQKFTKQQWEKEAFSSVYQDLTKFNYTTLSDYKLQNTTGAHSATSSDSNITATASASSAAMSHKIEVTDVATSAYVVSTKSLNRQDSFGLASEGSSFNSSSIKLADVLFSANSFKLTASDSDYSYSNGIYAGNMKATNLNGQTTGDDTNQYVSSSTVAFSITVGDGTTKKDSEGNDVAVTKKLEYTYGDLYNGKTFNDLVSDINGLGLNVRATYDSVNDKFSFYNNQTGSSNGITFTADTTTLAGSTASTLFENMQLLESRNGSLYGRTATYDSATDTTTYERTQVNVDSDGNMSLASGSLAANQSLTGLDGASVDVKGTDTNVKIDGVSYNNLSKNSISVGGVNYSWTNPTSDAATVTVSQDTDKIVENVKKFVEDYNKLLSSLYEKYDEKKADGKYEPLTDKQKEGMKDEQIEKWEEKAKQGLLYHDSTIRKVIDRMRDSISTPIEGLNSNYNSAYSIGISTTGLKGQLTLDEDKLKKALAADENAAYNVIGRLSEEDDFAHNGLAQRLGDYTLQSISDVKNYAGTDGTKYDDDSDLGNLMKSLKEKMDNFKTMMQKFEDALYKKYDAMEVTLSQLGTQLSFITG